MLEPILSVREINSTDIGSLIDYWFGSERSFLIGMGVDPNKLPTQDKFSQMLIEQMNHPYEKRVPIALFGRLMVARSDIQIQIHQFLVR